MLGEGGGKEEEEEAPSVQGSWVPGSHLGPLGHPSASSIRPYINPPFPPLLPPVFSREPLTRPRRLLSCEEQKCARLLFDTVAAWSLAACLAAHTGSGSLSGLHKLQPVDSPASLLGGKLVHHVESNLNKGIK